MGTKWSDVSNTDTDLAAGDKVLILRESAGAAGSIIMDIEDFINSLGELFDKFPYIVSGMMLEPQPGSAVIAIAVPPVDVTIPSSGNLSCGKALIAATDDTTFSIKKNGSEVGTMFVTAGSTIPVFNFPSDVSLTGGTDYLTVVNPASPDATLASFGFSIVGRR